MQSQFSAQSDGTWVIRPDVTVNYLVVAGGGGSRCFSDTSPGGGAGGYRASGFGPSPLQGSALELYTGDYTVTVGGGGTLTIS
jgi:hypothetical protein